MEKPPRRVREKTLELRPANLPPTFHVTRCTYNVGPLSLRCGHHIIDDLRRITEVCHRHNDKLPIRVLKPGLYCIQRTTSVLVLYKSERDARLALELTGRRKGRVLVVVVYKPGLSVDSGFRIKLSQSRLDIVPFVVYRDYYSDARAQIPPILICSSIQGMTSSRI